MVPSLDGAQNNSVLLIRAPPERVIFKKIKFVSVPLTLLYTGCGILTGVTRLGTGFRGTGRPNIDSHCDNDTC